MHVQRPETPPDFDEASYFLPAAAALGFLCCRDSHVECCVVVAYQRGHTTPRLSHKHRIVGTGGRTASCERDIGRRLACLFIMEVTTVYTVNDS